MYPQCKREYRYQEKHCLIILKGVNTRIFQPREGVLYNPRKSRKTFMIEYRVTLSLIFTLRSSEYKEND